MYEEDTGLIYMRARYYSPVLRRFVNADKLHGDISNALTLNRYSFCNGDPANGIDPMGLAWDNARGGANSYTALYLEDPHYYSNKADNSKNVEVECSEKHDKILAGAGNVVFGGLQMFVGAALGATLGWTGFGSAVAAFLIFDGAATVTQGAGQIVNGATDSSILREDNMIKTGVQEIGNAIAGEQGEKTAGVIYDITKFASNTYACRYLMQEKGLIPRRVSINKILNNPEDEYVKIGPRQGLVSEYTKQFSNGLDYGKIYATHLQNGYYQLADGHHRVQALRNIGEHSVKIFITK